MVTREQIQEAIAMIIVGTIVIFLVNNDLSTPKNTSFCDIDPQSSDCYYEELNNDYDQYEDAQCGGTCRGE